MRPRPDQNIPAAMKEDRAVEGGGGGHKRELSKLPRRQFAVTGCPSHDDDIINNISRVRAILAI